MAPTAIGWSWRGAAWREMRHNLNCVSLVVLILDQMGRPGRRAVLVVRPYTTRDASFYLEKANTVIVYLIARDGHGCAGAPRKSHK